MLVEVAINFIYSKHLLYTQKYPNFTEVLQEHI